MARHLIRSYTIIAFLLIPVLGLPQVRLTGIVKICDKCKGVNIVSSGSTGFVNTKKTINGKIRTVEIHASYQLYQNGKLIKSGLTNSKGKFTIEDLPTEQYHIKILVNKLLQADSAFELTKRNSRMIFEIDDSKLWTYVDSVRLARYNFNAEIAKEDIKNNKIRILTAGLPVFTSEQLNSVTTKYGFKYEAVAGCMINKHLLKAMNSYNNVVYEYLDKINEPNWRKSFESDLEELMLIYKHKD